MSKLQVIIKEFFNQNNNWSLLKFPKYRETTNDFTYEKDREHMLYRKSLDLLSKNDKAQSYIQNFKVAGYNFTLTNKVTQQISQIKSTTTRVAKYFSDIHQANPSTCNDEEK
ncbi:hypothetical protein GLOIN_2v1660456 [Rhizophagus clarus]|uniref:Uncharacterized protein n=1 Tax=Rhizophagus clarus TaxID=94130 RepID=A0A8H3KXI3_9GLOM|nr:hypothetical protein GLOIN_2v1660456 [Rhizophagus clarus]